MTELSIRGSYHPIPSLDEDRKNEELLAPSKDGMGWYNTESHGLGVLMIDMTSRRSQEVTQVCFPHLVVLGPLQPVREEDSDDGRDKEQESHQDSGQELQLKLRAEPALSVLELYEL